MTGFFVAVGLAFWLGVLTSISPCPLATNIAAISYIGRRVGSARQVFLSGILYTLGRTAAYVVLAAVLVGSVLSVPAVSVFLQKTMHMAVGPLLIVVGLFLLGWIEFSVGGGGVGESLQKRVDAMGIWGALLLGVVFALTFCPTSAMLFFGSLIPLALEANSRLALPSAYGAGTAVPVLGFAVLLATSAQRVGKAYHLLGKIEWAARMLTGALFVLLGVYFSLKYV